MALPPNMPEAGGKDVILTCFVDAGHANNQKDRRRQTGILIFVNKAPIHWYSKRENTVETSTFGAEFCAIKIAVEIIEFIPVKFVYMGNVRVPVEVIYPMRQSFQQFVTPYAECNPSILSSSSGPLRRHGCNNPLYVPVDNEVVVVRHPRLVDDGMTEANIIIQSLHWIRFRQNNQRQNIIDDCLGSFADIRMLSEKDITAMATEWAGRTSQNGRITFGVRRTKLLMEQQMLIVIMRLCIKIHLHQNQY